MRRNNYSVLAFHKRLAEQHHRKNYAYGNPVPVISDINQIPPFQIIAPTGSFATQVKMIRLDNATSTDVLPQMTNGGFEKQVHDVGDIFVYPSRVRLTGDIFEVGIYYLEFIANNGAFVRYSETFCIGAIDEDLIKLSFCNDGNIEFPNGLISYENHFENFVYFKSEIGKPKYEYEERVIKRDGHNFPLQQISYKLHLFEAFLNEEILDVLRLVRLHDFVKITVGGETTEVDEIVISTQWLAQGDIARTEFEIKTDTVVIANAKTSTAVSCEIGEGQCFGTSFAPVSTIVKNSTEFNNRFYISQETGLQVPLADFDRVVLNIQGNFFIKVYVVATDSYDDFIVSNGQIVYDQNFKQYYTVGANDFLYTNTLIKTDAIVRGVTMPGSTVEVWVQYANGGEEIIEVGTANEYSGDGIGYLQPAGATSLQVRHYSNLCGKYWTSDWVNFGGVCSFTIEGNYASIAAAISGGVQDDEFFLLTAGNIYGLPPFLVMQLNPTVEYNSDSAARAVLGEDTCYAVSGTNAHGLPRGIVRALVDTATTYDNDADAAATADIQTPEIYIWNGGNTGFNNLFKQSQLDSDGN
jgi:hypothetical protein